MNVIGVGICFKQESDSPGSFTQAWEITHENLRELAGEVWEQLEDEDL